MVSEIGSNMEGFLNDVNCKDSECSFVRAVYIGEPKGYESPGLPETPPVSPETRGPAPKSVASQKSFEKELMYRLSPLDVEVVSENEAFGDKPRSADDPFNLKKILMFDKRERVNSQETTSKSLSKAIFDT